MAQYTLHFQKHPAPGDLLRSVRGIASKVILLGDAAGFESAIADLRADGVEIEDRTESTVAALAARAIQQAKNAT